MLPSEFIDQNVFQELKETKQAEGKLLGKISPRKVTYKAVCLPVLDSTAELAWGPAHEVESPVALPGEKRREGLDKDYIGCWSPISLVTSPNVGLMLTEGKEQSQKPKYLLSLLSLKERWQVLNIWYNSASLVKYFSHALMSLWDKLHAGETKQTVFEVKKKKKRHHTTTQQEATHRLAEVNALHFPLKSKHPTSLQKS